MMRDFDVNISVPPAEEKLDSIKVTGPPSNVERVREALMEKVDQFRAEQEDRAARGFTLEIHVDPKYHPKIIGYRGAVITKIRQDHDVNVQFPERGSEESDLIKIVGYEKNTNSAKEAIEEMVREMESMVTEDVYVDHRIHPRIIGQRGKNIRKIMDDYKVDIKFPQRDSENPDLIQITGAEDNVWDCKDYLLNMEEEFLQDINDREMLQQFVRPSAPANGEPKRSDPKGFVVRDAPWSASSEEDFPSIGAGASKKAPVVWGPAVKR